MQKNTQLKNSLLFIIFPSALGGSECRKAAKVGKNILQQLGKLLENVPFFEICIYGLARRFGAHIFTILFEIKSQNKNENASKSNMPDN